MPSSVGIPYPHGPAAVGPYLRVLAHSWHNGGFGRQAIERILRGDLRLNLSYGWGPIVVMVSMSASGPYTHQMRHAEGVRFST